MMSLTFIAALLLDILVPIEIIAFGKKFKSWGIGSSIIYHYSPQ